MTAAVLITAVVLFSLLVLWGGWAKARGYRRGRTACRCHGTLSFDGAQQRHLDRLNMERQVALADPDSFGFDDWIGVFPAWFTDERISEDDAA